MAHSS